MTIVSQRHFARSVAVTILFSLLLSAAQGNAYCTFNFAGDIPYLHYGKEAKFYAGANSFPEGGVRRAALLTAISRWNESPGAFVFRSPYWGATNVSRGNGDDEVWMTSAQDFLDGAPMRAHLVFVHTHPPRIHEADVLIDVNESWEYYEVRDSLRSYGGDKYLFQSVLLHEMGHALGLCHLNTLYNIMGSDQTHISTVGEAVRTYVGEDAGNGDVQLYGQGSTLVNDLGVSHWKYWKASGEYSAHNASKIYPPGGAVPAGQENFDGFVRFVVGKGGTYDVQFTFENNGRDNFNGINVGFYVSTNDVITTKDTKIGSAVLNLYRNTPNTLRLPVTLPATLASGATYYLGVIIDDTNSINEYVEGNNAAYLPIRVK